MFLFTQKYGRAAAFFASTLFIFAPYRIFNLYYRGSLGESVALTCVPLLFYCIYRLFQKRNHLNVVLISLSYAALITSHNVIALVFTPVLILNVLYSSLKNKVTKKTILLLIIGVGLGIMLAAFFWLPAVWEINFTRNLQITV